MVAQRIVLTGTAIAKETTGDSAVAIPHEKAII